MPDDSHGACNLIRQDSEQLVSFSRQFQRAVLGHRDSGLAERPTPMPTQRESPRSMAAIAAVVSGHCGWMLRSEALDAAYTVSQVAGPGLVLERVSAFPSSGTSPGSVACNQRLSKPASLSSPHAPAPPAHRRHRPRDIRAERLLRPAGGRWPGRGDPSQRTDSAGAGGPVDACENERRIAAGRGGTRLRDRRTRAPRRQELPQVRGHGPPLRRAQRGGHAGILGRATPLVLPDHGLHRLPRLFRRAARACLRSEAVDGAGTT